MGRTITQQQLADELGLSSRQVRNLVERGMPTVATGGKVAYPMPAALKWYVAWKVEAALSAVTPAVLADAELRLMSAKARIAELDAAEKEGRMIDVADARRVMDEVLSHLRAGLLAFASKNAHRFVGCKTIAEAQVQLDPAIHDLMKVLAHPDLGAAA